MIRPAGRRARHRARRASTTSYLRREMRGGPGARVHRPAAGLPRRRHRARHEPRRAPARRSTTSGPRHRRIAFLGDLRTIATARERWAGLSGRDAPRGHPRGRAARPARPPRPRGRRAGHARAAAAAVGRRADRPLREPEPGHHRRAPGPPRTRARSTAWRSSASTTWSWRTCSSPASRSWRRTPTRSGEPPRTCSSRVSTATADRPSGSSSDAPHRARLRRDRPAPGIGAAQAEAPATRGSSPSRG